MGDLTANFSFAELTHSAMAENLGIDNTPSSETREHLLTLAENLEKLRSLFGVAIHVNSAYRSPALNKAVRGVSNSAHLTGYAADFVAPDFGPPLKIVERVRPLSMQAKSASINVYRKDLGCMPLLRRRCAIRCSPRISAMAWRAT